MIRHLISINQKWKENVIYSHHISFTFLLCLLPRVVLVVTFPTAHEYIVDVWGREGRSQFAVKVWQSPSSAHFSPSTLKSPNRTTTRHISGLQYKPSAVFFTGHVRSNNTVMPSLRHSFTLSIQEEPLREGDRRRKSTNLSRSKLVSTVLGLIINPTKVRPAEPPNQSVRASLCTTLYFSGRILRIS